MVPRTAKEREIRRKHCSAAWKLSLAVAVFGPLLGACSLPAPKTHTSPPPTAISRPPEDLRSLTFPTSPEMRASLQLIERAKEALEENRLDHAISLLEKALSLAPDNPLADLYLADAWNRKGVPERALGFAQRAQMKLSNRPGWLSLALTQEGLALEGLYRFDVAKGRYKEALRLYPGNARARERLRTLGGL